MSKEIKNEKKDEIYENILIKTEIYNNGKYKRGFKEGQREGHSVYTYNNKSKYENQFKNDLFDGKGIFTWENG